MSLLGPIAIRFAYYHCASCGQGYQPWCGTLRLDQRTLTPAAEEISSLAGVLGSFADGVERVLRKMSGLRLSESTIERTTDMKAAQRYAPGWRQWTSVRPRRKCGRPTA